MAKRWSILGGLFIGAVASVCLVIFQRPHYQRLKPVLDPAVADASYHQQILPLMKQYCWDCHGDDAHKGEINFDTHTNINAMLADRHTWERVMQVVRDGDMPPKKKKTQPTDLERTQLVSWLDKTLYPVDPANPDPGRVTLRRLNRAEYNNTVRDLVGVDFHPADDFPNDDVGYGFDNIGDVLSMPPLLLEKYVRAAEQIMDEAIVTGPKPPKTKHYDPSQISGHGSGGALASLASNGEMGFDYDATQRGDFIIRVKAYQDRAGDEDAKMAYRVDQKEVKVIDVAPNKGEKARDFEYRLHLDSGKHHVGIAFVNDYYLEKIVETKDEKGRLRPQKKTFDRNLHVFYAEMEGPFTSEPPPLTAFHKRVFVKTPKPENERAVAKEIIGRFAAKAFRRPVEKEEVDRLVTLYSRTRATGVSFESGVKQSLTAVLVSPNFLFREEIQPEPNDPQAVHPIGEYALASRLSYFLWSSMPDDELMELARKKHLRRDLNKQIQRMLQDPKSRALVDNFGGQWLQLRLLTVVNPDHEKFKDFDDDLRSSMRRETEMFFDYILRNDRPVTEFLTADYTFINNRLAKHYGMPEVPGDDFVKVSLKGTPRMGLLSQGSFLTLTSNPTRTSPVKRGKWVLDNLLGTPPPPPPPGVPELEKRELKGSLRVRMEQHRENPMCASCHARMDPIGFAFEHFDGIGRFRDTDEGSAIEPAGQLNTGEKFTDHQTIIALLAKNRQPDFLRCMTEKMLTYALGRGLEYYDRPAVEKIIQQTTKDGLQFSSLIRHVVDSVPFELRRGDGDPNQLRADAK
ncbi:MAG TPA: DUF1592 domain-containing protein [Candidatus Limnocylindria bacterium]|jgi:hypothetical protein|nr:DUF1592 domain-containing protein [Candidatus Limnocylindria bacterium]